MRLIVGDDQFKASTGWVYGFLERFGLSLRAITCRVNAHKFTSIRDNFDDKAEKMAAFRTYIKDVIYQHQFSDLQIYNVDQTPVWFDHPPSKVIDHRGAKQVYCKSMVSNLREKATVVLAVRQDGYKLPPLVVVKTSTLDTTEFHAPHLSAESCHIYIFHIIGAIDRYSISLASV
ncbi:hypothetical protein MIR68_007714 [Amoeboaphelidium protococcarum]|nr:hypothetical protein MIR68_007714 [Amoeboaphelidium protococcarum]